MPDAKNNAKLTGDTHPPEVEDLSGQRPQGRPATAGTGGDADRDLENEGRAGKGINQAGYLKDKDKDAAGGSDKD